MTLAPKEQPPRKLSGFWTVLGERRSGKRLPVFVRLPTEGVTGEITGQHDGPAGNLSGSVTEGARAGLLPAIRVACFDTRGLP